MLSKKIFTQIKRELWENKISFVYAPIAVSVLFLTLSFFVLLKFNDSFASDEITFNHTDKVQINGDTHSDATSSVTLSSLLARAASNGTEIYQEIISTASVAHTALLGIVFLVVMFSYAHACLFDDRKNRDILFWRSLPVSETLNVLIKIGFLIVYIPLIIFPLNLIISFMMALMATFFFASKGIDFF